MMKAKVIEINVNHESDDDLREVLSEVLRKNADELDEKTIDQIVSKITEMVEEEIADREMADRAFASWLRNKDDIIRDLTEACGGKLPEGEHLMSLFYAAGYREALTEMDEEQDQCS